MQLAAFGGSYDAVFSLGHLCLAAIQLEKNGLRPFAGPLDWMGSPSLPDVTRLIDNRFAGFMNYPHLKTIGKANDTLYLVHETAYNVYSNHDFLTHNNAPPHLAAYPQIKAKYDRRVARFLEKARTSRRILFIRTEGSFEHVQALEQALRRAVAHEFQLLVVNHAPGSGIVELNWPLPNVCALQFPNAEIWEGNNALWTGVLRRVKLYTP